MKPTDRLHSGNGRAGGYVFYSPLLTHRSRTPQSPLSCLLLPRISAPARYGTIPALVMVPTQSGPESYSRCLYAPAPSRLRHACFRSASRNAMAMQCSGTVWHCNAPHRTRPVPALAHPTRPPIYPKQRDRACATARRSRPL